MEEGYSGLTGLFKVLERDVVYRKKADGGAVFRTHVRNGGSVCSRELRHAGPKKLDKLPTDTSLAQMLHKHNRSPVYTSTNVCVFRNTKRLHVNTSSSFGQKYLDKNNF